MPAQFTIYRSSDVGAPTLSGTAGDLVNLLDKCLVTGYGAKAAAGWTKPFTGTNKAAFRPGAGTKLYLRVQDDAPGAGGAKEARITGYETMTAVDTGTAPFPTAAQGVGGIAMVVARKSNTANATVRDWIVVADSRTCYVFVLTGDVANNYFTFAFGDFYSFKTDDAYNCMIMGRLLENSANDGDSVLAETASALTATCSNHFFARGHTQLGGSVKFGKHIDLAKGGGATGTSLGIIPFTNPEDAGIYLAPYWIHDPTTVPVNGCRGRIRGLWAPLHPVGSLNDGDTFSGGAVGELTGKTFLTIKLVSASGATPTSIAVETSATLETNI